MRLFKRQRVNLERDCAIGGYNPVNGLHSVKRTPVKRQVNLIFTHAVILYHYCTSTPLSKVKFLIQLLERATLASQT